MAAACASLFGLLLGGACLAQYRAFGYDDFDLAHHVQSVWQLLHGSLDCTILGIPWPGNHANWILVLVAPLFAVAPSPLTLLFLQAAGLALACWPIHLLAERECRSPWWGAFFAFAYCLYAPVGHVALYEFHPVAFATPLLLAAFYCARIGNNRWFVTWSLLAASCQEDIPLMVTALCVYRLLAQRHSITPQSKRLSLVLIGLMVGWFVLCVAVIGPHFNQGGVGWLSLYGQFGKSGGEIIGNLVVRPDIVVRTLYQGDRLDFLLRVLGPFLFLPCLAPEVLCIAAPSFLQHMLSLRTSELSVIYHYTAAITPFVVAAAVIGWARLLRWSEKVHLGRLGAWLPRGVGLALTAALLGTQFGYGSYRRVVALPEEFHRNALASAKEQLLTRIPADASVICSFDVMARLAMRRQCYSMHAVVSGHRILSYGRSQPPDVDYAAVDFADELTFQTFYHAAQVQPDGSVLPSSADLMSQFFGKNEWTCLGWVNSFAVFQRRMPGTTRAATSGQSVSLTPQADVSLPDGTTLAVLRDKRPVSEGRATLAFRWGGTERLATPAPSYWLWLRLTSRTSRQPITFLRGPCRLFAAADDTWTVLLGDVPGGEYDLSAVVYDRRAMVEAVARDPKALAGFQPSALFDLGSITVRGETRHR